MTPLNELHREDRKKCNKYIIAGKKNNISMAATFSFLYRGKGAESHLVDNVSFTYRKYRACVVKQLWPHCVSSILCRPSAVLSAQGPGDSRPALTASDWSSEEQVTDRATGLTVQWDGGWRGREGVDKTRSTCWSDVYKSL